jgi:hypothetical protein
MRYNPDRCTYLKANTSLASSTQGIANAIDFVVASKHFAATYSRPNFDNKIWCFTDGVAQISRGCQLITAGKSSRRSLSNSLLAKQHAGYVLVD